MVFAVNRQRKTNYYLKTNPMSLITQNIPSYMGGQANPWKDGQNDTYSALEQGRDFKPVPLAKIH